MFLAFSLFLSSPLANADPTSIDYSCLHQQSWLLNTNGDSNSYFSATTEMSSSSYSAGKWVTVTNRIPKYNHEFTTNDINDLNSRPKAATDFISGSTTAIAGTTYQFGSNIGYKTNSCARGYWPPGPVCPSASITTNYWDLNPSPETASGGCYTPKLGVIGRLVNGVSIYGSSDGHSYNNGNVWSNSAPEFEEYDMDICNGHAANGDYHHHHYPKCLAERLSDHGNDHSPLYGWMSDSYPVYGPYQSAGVLAVPCWKKRDYSTSSVTGCSDGMRSCQLLNPYDYSQGVISVAGGPSLTGTVTSLSGNSISSASGIYFEDYYFDSTCAAQGEQYLDSNNGHSHEPYGYHYHITIDSSEKALFPYFGGPKFHGCTSDGKCCTSRSSNSCTGTSTCSATRDGTVSYSCAGMTSTPLPTTQTTYSPTYKPSPVPSSPPSQGPPPQRSLPPTPSQIPPSRGPPPRRPPRPADSTRHLRRG